jgi:RNA:NAD 2'-phosphotransferase (TPT1/KptA family)
VQGHSLKTIDATSLLSPITLENQNIPETCVHGTFFASWPTILKSGGLKAMTRNQVHFASGPAVSDILPNTSKDAETAIDAVGMDGLIEARDREINLKAAMQKSEVVSGMRGDAQVLIYVDVKRSIEEGKMEWWRSENGVILTAGIEMHEEQLSELEETAIMLAEIPIDGSGEKPADKPTSPIKAHMHNRRKSQAQAAASKPQKLVPMAYWDVVVGIGIGILWSREKGVVQEIPAALLQGGRKKFASNAKTKPHLKNRGKGSEKPKMKVERDDMHGFD